MADRTWNAVDARLYEEMWSREARLLMGVILARCPNPYGVYDIPYLILSTLFEPQEIEDALEELVVERAIRLYRDRKVVWIIKKWQRAGQPNPNQQKGAYNEIFYNFNEVWNDFKAHYKGYLRGINGVSIPFPSESESDTESEKMSKKKRVPRQAGDNEYVKVWIDLYREIRSIPDYNPTGREIGELKKIWKHLKASMPDFKLVAGNYLRSRFVKNPSAKKLYESGIECYRNEQTQKAELLPREY